MSTTQKKIQITDEWESPSYTVIEALADLKDVSPIDLDPLYEHIDPEALDDLFSRSQNESITLTFTVENYIIQIQADTLTVTFIE